MEKSETIELLAQSLLKAQTEFMTATKDAKNPFFKSKYATLNSVWEAVANALHNNGLICLQPIVDNKVHTVIIHTSGQYIISECPIVCAKQNDPQALGSAITYSRRYALASMLGVMTDEDDDAESAMARPQTKPQQVATPAQVEPKKVVMSTTEQQLKIAELVDPSKIQNVFSHYNIKKLEELTYVQAREIIALKESATESK